MSENNVIEVRDLTVGYGTKVVQQDLNFTIKKGEIFVIMGGSGCGKSTVLKHIIGLYKPMAGEIYVNGENMAELTLSRKREKMQEFGVLYQSGALFGSMTVAENITLLLEEYTDYDENKRREIATEKLSLVNLQGVEDYYPSSLSGGMIKRVALARAMALSPDLLFFDEPSAGLDPITSAQLDNLICELRDKLGTTMVIVSHELDSVYSIADRIIMLDSDEQTSIAEGNPHDLRHKSTSKVKDFLNRLGKKF